MNKIYKITIAFYRDRTRDILGRFGPGYTWQVDISVEPTGGIFLPGNTPGFPGTIVVDPDDGVMAALFGRFIKSPIVEAVVKSMTASPMHYTFLGFASPDATEDELAKLLSVCNWVEQGPVWSALIELETCDLAAIYMVLDKYGYDVSTTRRSVTGVLNVRV